MSLSDADAATLLAAKFRGTAYTVGLSSTPPADDGSNITEPTDSAYARVTLSSSTANWTDPTADLPSRRIQTAVDISFPQATDDWDDIGYWVLFVGSRYVTAGRLGRATTVYAGTTAKLLAGDIFIICPPSRYSL